MDDTNDRLIALEHRLNAYHERLEQSLDHDRNFQLHATWGIVKGLVGFGAFAVTYLAASRWLDLSGWVLGLIGGSVGMVAFVLAAAWSDKGREGDEGKLSRMPRWKEIR